MTPRRTVLAGLGALSWPAPTSADVSTLPRLDVASVDSPALAAWCARVVAAYPRWWTGMTAALASPEFVRPETIVLRFSPLASAPIAITSRATITVNAAYVISRSGSPNLLCHELAHVAQQYPDRARPGWLGEGIADWVRYDLLIPDDPERTFDGAHDDYRRGYQPAAALLAWCEHRRPGTVRTINAAMRRGEDGDVVLAACLGASPDVLWRTFLSERRSPA